jgi:Rps23 Pro-64 3,4-dihydroxylase Tpa1-like proline 4-hydroxylase
MTTEKDFGTETVNGLPQAIEFTEPLDAGKFRPAYEAGRPWRHLVATDLLPREVIIAAEQEVTESARLLVPGQSNLRRSVKAEAPKVNSATATAVLERLNQEDFVDFLEELTGVPDLVPDPAHKWGGLHVYGPGHYDSVHRDFAVHPTTRLWHRVNVLVYLNSDWDESYGGHLELWPVEMTRATTRIAPRAGSMLIFETHHETLHGLPEPIACPPDRLRMSLASYYFSPHRPPGRVGDPIFGRPRRPQDPWRTGLAPGRAMAFGMADWITGGRVDRALRRLKDREV